jgi:hypothetical protein
MMTTEVLVTVAAVVLVSVIVGSVLSNPSASTRLLDIAAKCLDIVSKRLGG